jgi:hypothetical protein
MKLWIARDKDGSLYLYSEEPSLILTEFADAWEGRGIRAIDDRLFPEVTFENSPQQVEIKLVKEE